MKYLVFICLAGFLILACANPIPPTGGLRDQTPPVLDKSQSSPSNPVNFEKHDLEFTFDEFLVLDKADLQVLVSPPLTYKPKIELKDKTVHFRFDDREELKPNTTYLINFGESIKDFHEGNIVPDMIYVFSTGSYLDSMTYTTSIYDESEKKPAEKTTLMFYSDLGDSVVYNSLPDYAARTNKAGNVRLTHMRPGTYQVIALKDENLNYKYDLSNEKAGFLSEPVTLPSDGPLSPIRIFGRDFGTKIVSVDSLSPQRLRVNFDPTSEGVTWKSIVEGQKFHAELHPKFLDIYYQDTLRQLNIEVTRPLARPDTISVRLSPAKKARRVAFREEVLPDKLFPFVPGKPVKITFNKLIDSIYTNLSELVTSSGNTVSGYTIIRDTSNQRTLLVSGPLVADSSYTLILKKGALTDILGDSNDSTQIKFKITDVSTLGSISFKIDSLNADFGYLVSLVKAETVWRRWYVSDTTSFKTEITDLPADTYEVKIMEDRNKNRYQDKGSFDNKELPEVIYSKVLEQLRQNWSVEAEINMNDFKTVED